MRYLVEPQEQENNLLCELCFREICGTDCSCRIRVDCGADCKDNCFGKCYRAAPFKLPEMK